jgi:hypothetical protein
MKKNTLNIGIDANVFSSGQLTGIGKTIFQLVSMLNKLNTKHKITIYSKDESQRYKKLGSQIRSVVLKSPFNNLTKSPIWTAICCSFH